MGLSAHDYQRPVLLGRSAVLCTRRAQRAALPEDSPGRWFYLGVDAAAQEVLHPELGVSRAKNWLEGESRAFREGYVRTSDLLAMAKVAAEPPVRLPLPDFSTSE